LFSFKKDPDHLPPEREQVGREIRSRNALARGTHRNWRRIWIDWRNLRPFKSLGNLGFDQCLVAGRMTRKIRKLDHEVEAKCLLVRRDGRRASSPIVPASHLLPSSASTELGMAASRRRDYRARGRLAKTRAMPPRIAIDESDRRIVIASPSAMVPASAVMRGTLN
jgi:hypothetical protein